MTEVKKFLHRLIDIKDDELDKLLAMTYSKKFKRKEILSAAEHIPTEGFFILKGMVRLFLVDYTGTEKTIDFTLENQIIGDYKNMIKEKPALLNIQAIEETEVLVVPISAVRWILNTLREGQKLGRLLIEQHFFLYENRIIDHYQRSPKERYDNLTNIYPDIHNRVPQHMIASYLGISSVHLSRLKKADRKM